MCGIVGMIGSQGDVVADTIRGLKILEYRGYDSWGFVLFEDGRPRMAKDVGSVTRAHAEGHLDELGTAPLAIGHTRWATHGGVSRRNAHPHLSVDGRVAVVHNGVIENHLALRHELEADGVEFRSETDSEVVAHLVARELRDGEPFVEAIGRVIARLDGEFGLAIGIADDPGAVYGAKRKSPLLLAHNGERAVLASDQLAAIGIAEEVVFVHDGDVVRLTPEGADIFAAHPDGSIEPVEREVTSIGNGYKAPDKDGYDHFMLKEMHEVPNTARAALAVSDEDLRAALPHDRERLTLIGAGSAFYVARIAQYFLRRYAGLQTDALPSDEAPEWATFDERDALVAISQSGETFDTLEVVRTALDAGSWVTSVSNVPNSTQERLASHCIHQGSGPEICVLSTKSIVSQVLILIRAALLRGLDNGNLSEEAFAEHDANLRRLPATLEDLLSTRVDRIEELARRYSSSEHWFFVGRGPFYPLALESALKFKEVSYRHAEGLPAGFFKHGTISLIDEAFHTVALLPSKHSSPTRFGATLSNISEIVARNGPVIAFGPDDATEDDLADIAAYIPLPYHDDDASDVVIQLLAGQLFAYFCALSLGREIDQPRSLAKAVTVR